MEFWHGRGEAWCNFTLVRRVVVLLILNCEQNMLHTKSQQILFRKMAFILTDLKVSSLVVCKCILQDKNVMQRVESMKLN